MTNNNKLTPENINKIVDTFAQRAEEAHFSHLAEYSEVQENDYNLSVSTYVEAKNTREKIDIVKLNAEIAQIVARETNCGLLLTRSWQKSRAEMESEKKDSALVRSSAAEYLTFVASTGRIRTASRCATRMKTSG